MGFMLMQILKKKSNHNITVNKIIKNCTEMGWMSRDKSNNNFIYYRRSRSISCSTSYTILTPWCNYNILSDCKDITEIEQRIALAKKQKQKNCIP